MNATICRNVVCRTALLAVAFGCLDAQLAAAAETSERSSLHERIARGRVLFDRDWRNPTRLADADTKKLKGDGLGPMYNDVSCANCHHQGGKGGGGKAEKNV